MSAPLRRGACPGLSTPMQTGDGLLVRLLPIGTVPLGALKKFCAAALTFGNGIVEITARGNIQARGLTAASAPRFAEEIATLDIAAADGISVLTDPLAGIAAAEIADVSRAAADLRRALVHSKLAMRLSPKVSVVVDGGGALNLDRLSADVRLCAERRDGAALLRISVGGDGADATHVGFAALADGVAVASGLLDVIAQHGREARAKAIVAAEGAGPFKAAIAEFLVDGSDTPGHDAKPMRREVIGAHRLRDGLFGNGSFGDESFALALGLAFGHADAMSLESLAAAAAARGAVGVRTAPDRTLVVVGLAEKELTAFAADADRLGFIVHADDPRRRVIACAGAPICASGHMAARTIAPEVAKAAAQFLDPSLSIHISGCAKGCAHPGAAFLTAVGTPEGCVLIAGGSVRDAPFAAASADRLPAAIVDAIRGARQSAARDVEVHRVATRHDVKTRQVVGARHV